MHACTNYWWQYHDWKNFWQAWHMALDFWGNICYFFFNFSQNLHKKWHFFFLANFRVSWSPSSEFSIASWDVHWYNTWKNKDTYSIFLGIILPLYFFMIYKFVLEQWSLLTLYGLFSKNKKQIAFSLFSGGRGGPKWGQDGVWGLVSRRRTTPDPIETPFGPPQPPEYRENKIEIFLFWEKTYNVNTNLSLSWAYFSEIQLFCAISPSLNWSRSKNEPPDPSLYYVIILDINRSWQIFLYCNL